MALDVAPLAHSRRQLMTAATLRRQLTAGCGRCAPSRHERHHADSWLCHGLGRPPEEQGFTLPTEHTTHGQASWSVQQHACQARGASANSGLHLRLHSQEHVHDLGDAARQMGIATGAAVGSRRPRSVCTNNLQEPDGCATQRVFRPYRMPRSSAAVPVSWLYLELSPTMTSMKVSSSCAGSEDPAAKPLCSSACAHTAPDMAEGLLLPQSLR